MWPNCSLLWWLMAIIGMFSIASAFQLEGSPTSYAQFRKWFVTHNGTLELEFKTDEPNGLLMYTDDGGTFDFFELKLVEGTVRLRYNLGSGASILTVGKNLNDNEWHKVSIVRNEDETKLVVDHLSSKKTLRGAEVNFGNYVTNSYVYVGGVPVTYANKLNLLALPSVYYELRFRGHIRNVVFADGEGLSKRQEYVDFNGLRNTKTDICDNDDPCQNGGICISTDKGAFCDCRFIDFEGTLCEKGNHTIWKKSLLIDRAPSVATFHGNDYLSYDISKAGGEPIVSSSDQISFYFKTKEANGLLFFTGHKNDHLSLAMKDGGILLNINLGSGSLERHIKSSKLRFDDNFWHNVTVKRKIKEESGSSSVCQIMVTIDGVYSKMESIKGLFTMIYSSIIYIGGSSPTFNLPGSLTRRNFIGCLRKVEFSADGLNFNLLGLASSKNLITIHGNVQFTCQEKNEAHPIMFTTSESFLILPTWDTIKAGQISFRIRTNEPNGLLMLNSGPQNVGGDYFAFELFEGYIYLVLNLGSGSTRIKSTGQRVDDKQWHNISFSRSGKSGRFSVDDSATDFMSPGEASQLDLMGSLLVGGFGSTMNSNNVPGDIWTSSLGYGYIGCMSDLIVNGKIINMASYAKSQNSKGILPFCHAEASQCHSSPCSNGGVCSEGWNRFVCDCSGTHYNGKTCGKVAGVLTFNGKQYMKVTMEDESRTQVEMFSLRFRTSQLNGVLLATKTDKTSDRLQVGLVRGKIRFAINLGEKEKVMFTGDQLHDNQWHTLRVKRYGHTVEIYLDERPKVTDFLPGKHTTLDFNQIIIGAISSLNAEGIAHQFANESGKVEQRNFIGHMQQFVFVKQHFFDMAKNLSPNIEFTAVFEKMESLMHRAIKFKSKHTFIGLPPLKSYSSINFYFQLKTLEPNGLIFYNKGKGHDFIAVELVSGHLHFVFHLGDGYMSINSKTKNKLNDNKWHEVTVERTTVNRHILVVDGVMSSLDSNGNSAALDLDGILYLGGVPTAIYDFLPKTLQSKHGFEGCLASIDVNGEYMEPIADAVMSSSLVTVGCDDFDRECHPNSCFNKGLCIQKQNGYVCDCEMTSFIGPKCADDGVAYEFGPNGGLVTFTFPPERRPDTKTDNFTIAFVSKQKQGLIVRIDSMTSPDYIELLLVDGSIVMTYNMGTADHSTEKIGNKLNDGVYHVVRVRRSGANSSIQLDDYGSQFKNPPGKQLIEFNSQSRIQIGGLQNTLKDVIEKPFFGSIAGFVFNGLRILDLVVKKDPRTYVQGDVKLIIPSPNDHGQGGLDSNIQTHNDVQQTTAITSFEIEELVFSGSGCGVEDDEDCKSVYPSGNDDLITPVYIPPTPKPQKITQTTPTTTTVKPTVSSTIPTKSCDDDEECKELGSGDGGTIHIPTKVSKTLGPTLKPTTVVIPTTTTVIPSVLIVTSRSSPEDDNDPHGNKPAVHDPATVPVEGDVFYSPTTEPMDIVTPKYEVTHTISFPSNTGRESTSGSTNGDGIALVIGIIAGILSVVISIILLVFKFCVQSEGTYKVDESKNYQFSSIQGSAALLQHGGGSYEKEPCQGEFRGVSGGGCGGGGGGGGGGGMGSIKGIGYIINQGVNPRNIYGNNSTGFSNGHQLHPNGNVDNREKKLSKKKDLKDVKEWYV